jgi:hypothetical protein
MQHCGQVLALRLALQPPMLFRLFVQVRLLLSVFRDMGLLTQQFGFFVLYTMPVNASTAKEPGIKWRMR